MLYKYKLYKKYEYFQKARKKEKLLINIADIIIETKNASIKSS